MSFKEFLLEIGPDNLLPEKLLPSLLQIKPDDADSSVALILAEILIPGSQELSPTNGGVTSLTFVNNLPEANAKGAQLQACLKKIESNKNIKLNWFAIFARVQDYLFDASKRGSQPSVASITQLFSTLDYKQGPIDVMLNFDWWFDKTLLFMLQSMYTKPGAFDIMNSPNLQLCYEDENPSEHELLKFVNIARLEVQVMSKISAQASQKNNRQPDGDKKLETWLTQFFDLHCRAEPHHVIAGALSIPDKNGYILDRIDRLFAFMMERPWVDDNVSQLGKVLQKFKELDISLAISKLIEFYTTRATSESLTKVVETAHTFELFDELTSKAKSMSYSLYLTFLVEASTITPNVSEFGDNVRRIVENDAKEPKLKASILQAVLETLETRVSRDCEAAHQNNLQQGNGIPQIPPRPMKVYVVYGLLEVLKGSQGFVDSEHFKNLQLSLLTTYPRLINFGTGHDNAIIENETNFSNSFPPQVESEMKTFYSQMYSKNMEIKDIVEMLGRIKVSDVPHDQDVFACMVHSLIDEYRFFSEYPLNALASTSLLFGALLQKDLIQGTTLTVALNFIWESCNQPQDSHMFKFAVQSLYNFKSRLHEYPRYCNHLLKCQSLSAHAKMYKIVKDASNGIPCPDSIAPSSATASETQQAPKAESIVVIYNSISAVKKTIGLVTQEDPNEAISDKLLFFVNNMTSENMLNKLAEVKGNLNERFFSWFANYLVKERAKAEPNNHTLYTGLVFALDSEIFYEYVLTITLYEVAKLLGNFKDSTSERMHLKNLGAWLGKITLANDRPLKRDQIALKYLLVEGFDFKTLHIVIPFVCKILEQACHSLVFRCPNPWVLGIMKVLVELYECADLKLNLKFEIEVLLNAFDMNVKDIEGSTLIRTHNPNPEALAAMFGKRADIGVNVDFAGLLNEGPDQNLQMHQHLQQQAVMMQQQQQQHLSQLQHLQQARQMEDHVSQGATGSNQLEASFFNLIGTTRFTQDPILKQIFQQALARAVRECALPILSRISEAVLPTTEALVGKDFSTEADSTRFRESYQIMAQQLAHSMVGCGGRKILAETLEATMVQMLGNRITSDEGLILELSSAIYSNVSLCVEVVESLATHNISELIDGRMRSQVVARERHPKGEPYIDECASTYALHLPPPLGLNSDGLHDQQLKVYTGFGANAFINRTDQVQNGQVQSHAIARASPSDLSVSPLHQLSSQQPTPQSLPQTFQFEQSVAQSPAQLRAHETIDRAMIGSSLAPHQTQSVLMQEESSADQLFGFITQTCDKAIQTLMSIKEKALNELPTNHPILQALSQALALCQSNASRHPELLLKVAQYAVNCLFTQVHENPMSNEIYVVILDKLCECSPSTAKDVTWWMVHSSDQRKFNMPVMLSLLKVQLVTPLKLDSSIGQLIAESNSAVLVKFASSLLLNVFGTSNSRPIALRSEFACTLDALLNYDPEDTVEHRNAAKLRDELFKLLNESSAPFLSDDNNEGEGFVQMGYIFVEWVKLVGHSENSEGLQNVFIDKLFHCGILTEPEKLQTFLRAAIEISTTAFVTEHEIRSRTQREALLSVDCLSLLITRTLLKFNKTNTKEAAEYMKVIFSILVLVLVNEHEVSKSTWNERAYFKLLSSLLCSWSEASTLDSEATIHLDKEFYSTLGDVFDSLQPLIYPGFTFAWISLIAHRMFLPKLLELPEKAGYNVAVKLLSSLLKFQTTYTKDKSVNHDVINVIFKAINRIFIALAHDSPEFLIACHYQLVTAVPFAYLQIKNIILSATPRDISATNPYSMDSDCTELPLCADAPIVNYEPIEDLSKAGLRKSVENFIRIPAPALLRTIYNGLKLSSAKDALGLGYESVNFNTKLINALVLHVGISALEDKSPRESRGFNPKCSHALMLIDLLNQGCIEFRYHLIDAIANQLRAPNYYTQWFIGFFIHISSQSALWNANEIGEEIDEILVRVLLERHLVSKPHPWGLSVLLTELTSKEKYQLFRKPFIMNASPEVRETFETLARIVHT